MLLLFSLLLWCLSAVLEGAAVWVLFSGVGGAWWLVLASVLHLLYALLLAVAAYLVLPLRYRRPALWTLAYLFCAALFIPVLALPGLLLGVLLSLHRPAHVEVVDWEGVVPPELPFKSVQVNADAIYLHGGLATVLLHDDAPWRLRAVMATRHLGDRRALPVLRTALKDPIDEVRLLAYALLNGKERRIDASIQALRDEAQASPPPDSDGLAGIDEQIAALYLEQAELGLAEGEVQKFVLEQAMSRIDAALENRNTASRQFLRGRICLRLGLWDKADAALDSAEELGLAVDKTAPYRAESAFMQRDYDAVRAQLARLTSQVRAVPVLAPLVEYWS